MHLNVSSDGCDAVLCMSDQVYCVLILLIFFFFGPLILSAVELSVKVSSILLHSVFVCVIFLFVYFGVLLLNVYTCLGLFYLPILLSLS